MHRGEVPDDAQINDALARRGVLARILGPVSRRVDEPWKMFPVGIMFGLGFDAATMIALFAMGTDRAVVCGSGAADFVYSRHYAARHPERDRDTYTWAFAAPCGTFITT